MGLRRSCSDHDAKRAMVAFLRRMAAAMSVCFRRFLRDVRFLSGLVPALIEIRRVARSSATSARSGPGPSTRWTSLSFWNRAVERYGDRPAIIFGDHGTYSFEDVDRLSNRCSRAALRLGLRPGDDTVAIVMENRPEFVFLVLGLAKIGIKAALLNTNVSGVGSLMCIRACGAKHVFFSDDMSSVVSSLPENDETRQLSFAFVGDKDHCPINVVRGGKSCEILDFMSYSDATIPPGLTDHVEITDTMIHIFTSGTTGLPKAAKISHIRFFGSSLIISRLCRIKCTDRIYCPLPLYHSSAIVLGLGLCLHNGVPLISRTKFSANEFWPDCVRHRATVIQYIGELCRYLCAAPHHFPDEARHSIRLALGNGLRPDVWERFAARFRIPNIVEFYAATESNVGLINTEGKVGAIGFLSPLLAMKHPGKILRFDEATGMPFRDGNGRCVETVPGEVGEFVGMINRKDITQRFDGYSDEIETSKKVLKDVFRIGDECFRSGDIMKKDEEGFIYFVDRIGDTFRWKGENVSTTEVEGVLQTCEGVCDCVVYGVDVNGYEGKAGMAMIRVEDMNGLPLSEIHMVLSSCLPGYAIPFFYRFTLDPIDDTPTFKHRKQRLISFGFDPKVLSRMDKIFFRSSGARKSNVTDSSGSGYGVGSETHFVELTASVYDDIQSGKIQL